ncbi:MAG: c-type cytochrome [Actinobacteria bacterium]|nr:c-type cytochrome [Actinomycetota bacterium]
MPRGLRLAFCVVVAAGLAWFHERPVSAQPGDPGRHPAGEHLYRRDCASCHGPAGEGTYRGVPLTDVGEASAHFYLSTGRMPIDDPYDEIRRRDPAYGEAEIGALVEFVGSLGSGPPVPDVADDGDVAAGGSLYRLHCAQCHGSTGVGVALAAGVTAPSVLHSTPTQVAEALIVGPGAMPVFTPAVLGDDETRAVVAYVDALQSGLDRGGHAMARSGRMDETLAAWGVGVLVMLVLARTIARRR